MQVLTDEKIRKIQAIHPTENDPMPFARAIEQATLAKLNSAEPVAYAVINSGYTNPVEHVCTSKQVADSWLKYCKDRSVIPLFMHPPAPVLTFDGLTAQEFALRELYEFQEATGCSTADEFIKEHPPAPSAARDKEMINMVANNRN